MALYVGGRGYGARVVPDEFFLGLTTGLHRVVGRNPLVGTLRLFVAREQDVVTNVFGEYVVAGWQAGFEKDLWPPGLRDGLAVHGYLDVSGTLQNIHPMVGIPGMNEDLLVLLVPMIHLTPIEGQVTCKRRSGIYRLRVAPHGVLCDPITHPHGPVGGVAFKGTVRRVIALLEEVHADVLLREVVDGQ